MKMGLDEYAARFPGRHRPVPGVYAGEWVAWNDKRTEVLAHGQRNGRGARYSAFTRL